MAFGLDDLFLGAVTVGSALLGSSSADKAADAQVAAANEASRVQLQMYNQTREDQLPWLQAGQYALQRLTEPTTTYTGTEPDRDAIYAKYGVSVNNYDPIKAAQAEAEYKRLQTVNALRPKLPPYLEGKIPSAAAPTREEIYAKYGVYGTQDPDKMAQAEAEYQKLLQEYQATGTTEPSILSGPGVFEESPYYQLGLAEQNRQTDAALAARGLYGSGKALKDLQQNAITNMAYNRPNWINEWVTTKLNPFQSLAGLGQTSAQSIGNAALNTGNLIGGNALAAGQARAGGYINQANAYQQLGQNAIDLYGTWKGNNSLSTTNNSYAGAGTPPTSNAWWDGYQWIY